MANELGTPLDNFARRESPALWIGLSAVIVLSLLVLTARDWLTLSGEIGRDVANG